MEPLAPKHRHEAHQLAQPQDFSLEEFPLVEQDGIRQKPIVPHDIVVDRARHQGNPYSGVGGIQGTEHWNHAEHIPELVVLPDDENALQVLRKGLSRGTGREDEPESCRETSFEDEFD